MPNNFKKLTPFLFDVGFIVFGGLLLQGTWDVVIAGMFPEVVQSLFNPMQVCT